MANVHTLLYLLIGGPYFLPIVLIPSSLSKGLQRLRHSYVFYHLPVILRTSLGEHLFRYGRTKMSRWVLSIESTSAIRQTNTLSYVR